jgi:hypothetical protein
MRATHLLYNLGQNIWLDNITRSFLTGGRLRQYIKESCVTGSIGCSASRRRCQGFRALME